MRPLDTHNSITLSPDHGSYSCCPLACSQTLTYHFALFTLLHWPQVSTLQRPAHTWVLKISFLRQRRDRGSRNNIDQCCCSAAMQIARNIHQFFCDGEGKGRCGAVRGAGGRVLDLRGDGLNERNHEGAKVIALSFGGGNRDEFPELLDPFEGIGFLEVKGHHATRGSLGRRKWLSKQETVRPSR